MQVENLYFIMLHEQIRRRHMKKVDKKIFLVFTIVIVLVIGGYFQFVKPIKVIRSEIDCYVADSVYPYISTFAEDYEKNEYYKDTTFLHSWDGKLPSENPDDYMGITWNIILKNRCIYENILVDAYISGITNHKEAVLISNTASHVVTHYVNKLSEGQIWVLASVYIKDLNSTQIEELIKGMTVDVQYSGEFMSMRTETVKYKSGDMLEINVVKE